MKKRAQDQMHQVYAYSVRNKNYRSQTVLLYIHGQPEPQETTLRKEKLQKRK